MAAKKTVYLFLILVWIALDQAIKFLVSQYAPGTVITVLIPGVFQIRFLTNSGIAFGLFSNHPVIFSWLNLSIAIYLGVYFFRLKSSKIKISFALILAGAISNLTDRFIYSGVIDYLDFSYWPTFNLADTYITIGLALFLKYEFKKNRSI